MVASLDSAFGGIGGGAAPAGSVLDGGFSIGRRSASSSGGGSGGGNSSNSPSGGAMAAQKAAASAAPPLGPPQPSSAAGGGADGAGSDGGGSGGISSYLYPITTEEKLHTLSQELQRQREYLEQQRVGYFDKLISRRRDLLKLVMFCLIIILALSIHGTVKHYYRVFFDTNVMTGGKELLIRIAYPLAILFAMWNTRILIRN